MWLAYCFRAWEILVQAASLLLNWRSFSLIIIILTIGLIQLLQCECECATHQLPNKMPMQCMSSLDTDHSCSRSRFFRCQLILIAQFVQLFISSTKVPQTSRDSLDGDSLADFVTMQFPLEYFCSSFLRTIFEITLFHLIILAFLASIISKFLNS